MNDISFRALDLNLLRVFDALLREGSVVGAATRLSITPSAVSHALSRLRALFNDPLFVRAPGGMRATPRAAEIGTKVQEGLQYLEGALTPASFVAAETARTFTVICSAYVSAVLLPGVIARMRQLAPRAGLVVKPWEGGALDHFEAGQVDLLLGDFGRVPEEFSSEVLFEDQPVWLVGREYILPSAATADTVVMRHARFAAMNPRLPRGSVLENGFERRLALDEYCGIIGNPVGGTPDNAVLQSLPYASIAPLVVKHADLAALLPRRLALLFARDLELDIVELPRRDGIDGLRIAAVWHPDHGARPALVWFRNLLTEVAGKS